MLSIELQMRNLEWKVEGGEVNLRYVDVDVDGDGCGCGCDGCGWKVWGADIYISQHVARYMWRIRSWTGVTIISPLSEDENTYEYLVETISKERQQDKSLVSTFHLHFMHILNSDTRT